MWALPRTSHWTGAAWEDAGFEVRDKIYHCFATGFPKSHNISNAIDREAGATREVVGEYSDNGRKCPKHQNTHASWDGNAMVSLTAPATPAAAQWDGWGTALKPAVEEWWVLRKPISEATVAKNVLRWGTGALNVDGCRVGTEDALSFGSRNLGDGIKYGKCKPTTEGVQHLAGRFPAHLIHDGSDEVRGCFPVTTSGGGNGVRSESENTAMAGKNYARVTTNGQPPSTGSAARFFHACPWDADDTEAARLIYVAKASKRDRDEGLGDGKNIHSTVKPTALMQYLIRLITPPGGVVCDPFMGSGSTGKAAMIEGVAFIGIEQDAAYFAIAEARIANAADPLRQMREAV